MICDECKQTNGRTCCEAFVGDVPVMPLSMPEIHRIAHATGLKPAEFTVVERLDPTGVVGLISISPVTRSLFVGDRIFRLKTRAVGEESADACVFLGEKGCTLERSVRPCGCLLFPFTYNPLLPESPDGQMQLLRLPVGPDCLAAEREPSDDVKLAASLGMKRTELLAIGELREIEAKRHRDLVTHE